MKLTVKGPRLLVERVDDQIPESTILTVIHLDDQPASKFADVIAVGDIIENIAVGSRVITRGYSGMPLQIEGHEYHIIQEDDVLAIIT